MIKFEPHVHSNHSDGRHSVRKILSEAIKKRIDVISITDHDTLNGSLEAIEVANEEHLPISVILGVEVSTRNGHLLVYGIQREIDRGMKMIETIEIVKELGGFTVLAHPFEFYRHGSVRIEHFKYVDAIEVFNAKSYLNFLANYFAKKYKKPPMAGSDAHNAQSVGYGLTLVDVGKDKLNINDQEVFKEEVFNAIKNFNVKIEGEKIPLRSRFSKLNLDSVD